MIKIAPSILSADFSDLKRQIEIVENAGAEVLHIDVMDGHFVPNISIGPLVVNSIRTHSNMIFDVHLMIENPLKYIEEFAKAGADIITVHYEAKDELEKCLSVIKRLSKKAGVSIKPSTPPQVLDNVIDRLDLVLVMGVEPGFGGQQYLDITDQKIAYFKSKGIKNLDISVDGGINKETIGRAVRAGANIIVAGSAVFESNDIKRAYSELVRIGEDSCGV